MEVAVGPNLSRNPQSVKQTLIAVRSASKVGSSGMGPHGSTAIMADKPVVHIGESSPEKIAYTLLHDVMTAEKKTLVMHRQEGGITQADRKYLLDTYAECLAAAQGRRHFEHD